VRSQIDISLTSNEVIEADKHQKVMFVIKDHQVKYAAAGVMGTDAESFERSPEPDEQEEEKVS